MRSNIIIAVVSAGLTLGSCCYSSEGEATAGNSSGTGSGTSGTGSTSGTACFTSEFQACLQSTDCDCGLQCVADPNARGSAHGDFLCERTCTADADCPNAVTACAYEKFDGDGGAMTCALRPCAGFDATGAATPGQACDIGVPDSGGGTCVPAIAWYLGNPGVNSICAPNGTATTCQLMTNSDDPYYGQPPNGSEIPNPQPYDPAAFCGAGEACYAPTWLPRKNGVCTQLCVPGQPDLDAPCPSDTVCVDQGEAGGFCLPCVSSGSDGGDPGLCLSNGDCCEQTCGERFGTGLFPYGYCEP